MKPMTFCCLFSNRETCCKPGLIYYSLYLISYYVLVHIAVMTDGKNVKLHHVLGKLYLAHDKHG